MRSELFDGQMRKALEMVGAMRGRGATNRDVWEYLRAEFGDDDDNPRAAFRCVRCRDTGVVMIFHPDVIRIARRDPDNAPYHKRCAALCSCSAGEAKGVQFRSGNRIPIFGEKRWHIDANDPDGMAKCSMFEPIAKYDAFREFEL